MAGKSAVKINADTWIAENKKFFLPPVCNKMLHGDGTITMFFVGGPNQRKDFHMEDGEELFLQVKGDMVLKVIEKNVHRDVVIKEGQMFLLPGRVTHSPQRFENTIGMVIERLRTPSESDGLRYFVEKENGKPTLEPLYEEWFHCTDLGTQLVPVIKRFFASEQHRTGKPLPGTIKEAPLQLDNEITLEAPFDFNTWISQNRQEIDSKGIKQVFDDKYQFRVFVLGKGENEMQTCERSETFIWQWEGESVITMDGSDINMKAQDTLLVPDGKKIKIKQEAGSLSWMAWQDPITSMYWKP